MPSTPALACSDLEVTFGDTPVLRGLSFEAHAGAVTALLGPNGAGKTTAIRVLTGLVAATAGTATTLGLPAGHPDALARIGLMPQATGAWSGVRPRELLRYLASLYPTRSRSTRSPNGSASISARRPPTDACPAASSRPSIWPAHW